MSHRESEIVPAIKAGKRVLVAAHGNSLRALVKHLDGVSDEDIVGLNIPTGVPFVYTLDADMKAVEVGTAGLRGVAAARVPAFSELTTPTFGWSCTCAKPPRTTPRVHAYCPTHTCCANARARSQHHYLADDEALKAAQAAVANQGKASAEA